MTGRSQLELLIHPLAVGEVAEAILQFDRVGRRLGLPLLSDLLDVLQSLRVDPDGHLEIQPRIWTIPFGWLPHYLIFTVADGAVIILRVIKTDDP